MSEKKYATVMDFVKNELSTNLGPNLSTLFSHPGAAAAAGIVGEGINSREKEHALLRSLGVGTGSALGAATRPVFKALSNKLLPGLNVTPGRTAGYLVADISASIVQIITAKKLRSAAEALGDIIATKQNNINETKMDKINLDSFHKLNPEARPKTAEQFKLALGPGWTRAGQIAKGALPNALTGAALGGITGLIAAPEGKGLEGMAKGVAAGTVMGGGAGALHHGMMTGTSDFSKDYRGIRAEQNRRQNKLYRNERTQNKANVNAYNAGVADAASNYSI